MHVLHRPTIPSCLMEQFGGLAAETDQTPAGSPFLLRIRASIIY